MYEIKQIGWEFVLVLKSRPLPFFLPWSTFPRPTRVFLGGDRRYPSDRTLDRSTGSSRLFVIVPVVDVVRLDTGSCNESEWIT